MQNNMAWHTNLPVNWNPSDPGMKHFFKQMIALALPHSWLREAVGKELGAYVALRGVSPLHSASHSSVWKFDWNLVIENINNGDS